MVKTPYYCTHAEGINESMESINPLHQRPDSMFQSLCLITIKRILYIALNSPLFKRGQIWWQRRRIL